VTIICNTILFYCGNGRFALELLCYPFLRAFCLVVVAEAASWQLSGWKSGPTVQGETKATVRGCVLFAN